MQNKSFSKNILHGILSRFGKMFNNPYQVVNINPFRLIYYKHLAPGKIRTHQLFDKPVSFLSSTELLHGLKEIFMDEIYKQDLPAKPYIIDCGANIGLSVIYMKRLYPDAEILAFEPDEQNFELLKQNVQAFGYFDVVLKKEAVWVENQVMSFSGRGSTDSKLVQELSGHSVLVNAIRLKDIIHKKTDFLKIDIEGAEFAVLNDIQENLHFVQNLFFEYHGNFSQNYQLNEILVLLVNHGFNYYIREATSVYGTPFYRAKNTGMLYNIQLNIFCFRINSKNDGYFFTN
jgi:FkbM family methyltransferase